MFILNLDCYNMSKKALIHGLVVPHSVQDQRRQP